MNEIKRGCVVLVNFSGVGSEQKELRPAIVVSNNMCNTYSPVITVAPLTSKVMKRQLPTHITLAASQYPVLVDSVVLLEQTTAIDKRRIEGEVLFSLNELEMVRINRAITIQMGLDKPQKRNDRVAM